MYAIWCVELSILGIFYLNLADNNVYGMKVVNIFMCKQLRSIELIRCSIDIIYKVEMLVKGIFCVI